MKHHYFKKNLDCIKAFWVEAIQFSEEQCFSNFLKAVQEKPKIKQLNHFWKIVIQNGIAIITQVEATGSSVTAKEAKKFLTLKENPNDVAAAIFEESGDVDDLLDLT